MKTIVIESLNIRQKRILSLFVVAGVVSKTGHPPIDLERDINIFGKFGVGILQETLNFNFLINTDVLTLKLRKSILLNKKYISLAIDCYDWCTNNEYE